MFRHIFCLSILLRTGCLLLLLAVGGGVPSTAQTSMEGGARAAALGGAHTALVHDAEGFANPASWATLPGRAVTFFTTEAFGVAALRLGAAHYTEPTRFGTLAAGARTFGFEAYRETHLHAGYAAGMPLGASRRIDVGVRLRYYRVSIPGYGHTATLGGTVGGLVALGPALHVGVQAMNLHTPRLAGDDALPRLLALGLAYTPTDALRVVVESRKDEQFPLSLRGGFEWQPLDVLILRAGAATEPTRFTAGAGFRLARLTADVAGEHHDVLGWSPALSVGMQW